MPTPARDTLKQALKALQDNPENPEAAIEGFEAEAADLRSQADSLEQIANGIRGLLGNSAPPAEPAAPAAQGQVPTFPQPSPTPPTGIPEGMEAVRRIMGDGEVWTVREVFEEMKRRGWESKDSNHPIRPAEAAINRLWKVKREIERVGRAQYRYIGAGASGAEPPNGLFNGVRQQ